MSAQSSFLCDPNAVCPAPTIAPPPRADSTTAAVPRREAGAGQIVELILKDGRRLHEILFATRRKVDFASRLLGISLGAFFLYGVAMAMAFAAAGFWPHPAPIAQWLKNPDVELIAFSREAVPPQLVGSGFVGRAARLIFAYSFGLIAASAVCLPSLYFYGLLSGLRLSMADVALHALKAKATAAVALIGILPIYAAFALGAIVFPFSVPLVRGTLLLGLCLPFLAGLWGTRSLFVGFSLLCHTMPDAFQRKRACFLRRLVLSWCACYTAVAPVMIETVWQNMGG